ncbi:hypothetical protein [Pseudomonas sp. FEN]|uniref:hypothetical protein n=1 Tax=Pseudomonas sp. FEN TaxID=2767468 RepID=UPI0017498CF0|nr:hypothetical protein [Pseudomonas sp. FEN]
MNDEFHSLLRIPACCAQVLFDEGSRCDFLLRRFLLKRFLLQELSCSGIKVLSAQGLKDLPGWTGAMVRHTSALQEKRLIETERAMRLPVP